MSDAQFVLAFVLDGETSTLDDKKAVFAVAKECPAEMVALSADMGTTLGLDGKWA
jgi:hypothetical protein